MSKAFVKEDEGQDDTDDADFEPSENELSKGAKSQGRNKNYITPKGLNRLKSELNELLNVERPKVVEVVAWAASNGDRLCGLSELFR